MCMLIFHPPTAKRFTRAEFDDIYIKNKAGFGIIWRWPNSQAISYEKGLWTSDRIWSTYNALYDHGVREFVLHWRFATSGPIDVANCHPFTTNNDRVIVAHNGVLAHRHTVTESDTICFINDVLEPALRTGAINSQFVRWLEERIGQGNRLILWPRNANPVIVGHKTGLTHKGRWYSNSYAWSAPQPKWSNKWTNYRHWSTA